jgi:osmotically-inducible protein OsmY
MKTDAQLQVNVMEQLKWEPSLDHQHIGVSVSEGVITLSGTVSTFMEKHTAIKTAAKASGVKAIVENIEVKLKGSMIRTDEDIAKAVLERFKWSVLVPADKVLVEVANGNVTLKGTVDWEYQRKAAEKLIRELTGVKFVTNLMILKSSFDAINVKEKIETALKRAAEEESKKIHVDVTGGRVTLTGNVRSLSEMRMVEGTAWGCPGVTEVQDNLRVSSV